MKVTRKWTTVGQDPFEAVQWTVRSSKISNPDGSVVFEMNDAEVPASWSQLATDIMVSKYFRKAGVPQLDSDGSPRLDSQGHAITGPERSVKQVVSRLTGCWCKWGQEHGYFDSAEDAQAFEDELKYMLINQMAAPNSPQWFNTGLNSAYGISGPSQGHYYCDPGTGEVCRSEDAYTHPQPHACFIQSVSDDLVNEGGIMNLWTREARLFKYGSGTGSNFSSLRAEGEKLSGGGKSSGLMSWLRIGDRAAGAIKSGGTTRRAAKMVCLDMDHPDISTFVNWKVREEIKVAAMVQGMRQIAGQHASANDPETIGETAQRLGLNLDYDFNGEAYATVSGQNSNNSVRIGDAFFEAVDADGDWETRFRTTGEVARTYRAKELWNDVCYAAWRCADPGVQFDTTINGWHTCPSAGRINASNPCSEYMFLDDTACNLASINLMKFWDGSTRSFDVEGFEHAVDLWTVVLEISVLMASFPSERIAALSYRYRTLGLGFANLGAMLMRAGIAYDSKEGRAICGVVSALMCGRSYRMSALMAEEHGAFAGYEADQQDMLRVIANHRRAAMGVSRDSGEYEGLSIAPVPIDHTILQSCASKLSNAGELFTRATRVWDDAQELGKEHGYRNAQVTVIAPTGTIGLLMDCDTTGVEPDFALVKFKKLAGGGYFKIVNASVASALSGLGYAKGQVDEIIRWILGELHLDVQMPAGVVHAQAGESFGQWLRGRGMNDADLEAATAMLPGVFELSFAFGVWTLGDEALKRLGIDPAKAREESGFNVLKALGLSSVQIEALNVLICGTQTIEGAPHILDEHLSVFDCASTCGKLGKRLIAAEGHIRMMAACQPFISGAISKTINLPHEAKVEQIDACYRLSWELGLKANALYRDACKLSQPLNTASDVSLSDEDAQDAGEADALDEVAGAVAGVALAVAAGDEEAVTSERVQIVHRPMRRRLADTRSSITHKFNVAGHEGYLTVGMYESGMPGELFITMAKEGSTIGGLMDSLGTATSVALQYGVPLESLIKKFTHQRFEPSGMTMNPDIPIAKSLVDYIFRWLGIQFIDGYREANTPRRREQTSRSSGQADANVKQNKETRSWSDPKSQGGTSSSQQTVVRGVEPSGGGSGAVGALASRTVVNAYRAESIQIVEETTVNGGRATQVTALSAAMESMGDAPPCDVCGEITVRNGTCYKCLNCGNSMGCS